MTHAHGHGGGAAAANPRVSALRLILTLGGSGAFAGALILVAFALTSPAIEAHRAERLERAIAEVLGRPARYDTLYLVDGRLAAEPRSGATPAATERLFHGYDADGRPIGYAIVAESPGFADLVQVIFGYDASTHTVIGMKVLESKETPGLGDRIEKDSSFITQFGEVRAPLVGVKAGAGRGQPNEVDLITGATISSRTVVKIINDALARLEPALAGDGAAR